MADILKQIINISVEVFGANPLEVLFVLILLIAFLWLHRELRSQQMEERELQKERVEKSLTAFSLILSEGNTYKANENSASFIQAVYSALPFMDHKISKEMLAVLDGGLAEVQKVQRIIEIAKEEALFLSSFSNSYLFKTKSLTEDVERYFIKLRRIFEPVIASFFIIYSALLLLSISFSGDTYWWMFAKPFSFMIAFLLLPFSIDLLLEKKLTKIITVLLVGIFLSAIALTSGPEKFSFHFFIAFLVFLGSLVFYGYKLKQRLETT